MIWEWYALIGCGVGGLIGMVVFVESDVFFVTGVLTSIAAAVFLVLGLVGTIGPRVDRNACYKFGRQSHFEVKFIRYNTLSWDCLVRTSRYRWISKDNLQNVVIQK